MNTFKVLKNSVATYVKDQYNARLKTFIKDDEMNTYNLSIEFSNGRTYDYAFSQNLIDEKHIFISVVNAFKNADFIIRIIKRCK